MIGLTAKLLLVTFAIKLALAETSENSDSSENKKSPQRTHVVYLIADDLGWNDVSWHDESMITPNLQRLADEGVILENFYTESVCSPTRSALMTGFYPSRTGSQHGVFLPCLPHGLPVDLKILPEIFKEVGYKTYYVGKWHLGFCKEEYLPNSRGVDKFYGFYNGGMDFYTHTLSEFGPYRPGVYYGIDMHEEIAGQPSIPINNTVYATYLYEEKVIEYIDSHDASEPMFLIMSFQQVHSPAQVPQEYADMYEDTVSDLLRRNYSGQVTMMDSVVGVIRAKLEEKGMFEDSLIIFHSDNGGDVAFGASNWPLRGNKASLFEGGLKSVGLLAGKGIEKTGYVNHELYHVTDIFPSLVESVAKVSINYDIDGFNVWESLSTGAQSPREEFLITVDEDIPTDAKVAALRYHDWKFIEGYPAITKHSAYSYIVHWHKTRYHGPEVIPSPDNMTTPTWLFNLRNDPFEMHNLADEEPVMVEFLHDKLEAYRATAAPPFWPDEDPNCDPDLYGGFWSAGFC